MKEGFPPGRNQAGSAVRLRASTARPSLRVPWPSRLLFLLVMLALPVAVRAQFSYTVDHGEVTITGYTGVPGDLTIPSTLAGLPVTGVGEQAFFGRAGLTGVTLPDSVLTLDSGAFGDCRDLTRVTLGKGVTHLGPNVFFNCNHLAVLAVAPENPAFASADGVLFDKSQTLLIQYPPRRAGSAYAIPDSVTAIGDYAFSFCQGLTNISLGDQVVSIGRFAFQSCTGLTNGDLVSRAATIGDYAFFHCSGLTGELLAQRVTVLGRSAFESCSGLISITLPQDLTGIGRLAFNGCTNLASIMVAAGNLSYASLDGVLFDKNLTRLVQYPGGKTGTGYHLPPGVTTIGEGAFSGGAGTVNLTLPEHVTTLEANAFFRCRDLASVTLPDSISIIPDYAFSGCLSLTNVTLSTHVTSIGQRAFEGCFSLPSLTIPGGVTTISQQAFDSCTNLANFSVDAASLSFASVAGVLFDKSQTVLVRYPVGKDATAYVIPGSAAVIGDFAFSGCHRLTTVTLPDSLTDLGSGAFNDCTRLESITIPRLVAHIGSSAFLQCSNLTRITVDEGNLFHASVDGVLFDKYLKDLLVYPAGKRDTAYAIPPGVTQLDESAFYRCTALVALSVPGSVRVILGNAFQRCPRLTRVYFEGLPPDLDEYSFYGTPATIYHRPGTGDWPATIGERPVVSWAPAILTNDGGLGVSAGHFGFTITGASGVPVLVEASEDLVHPNWVQVSTNTCNAEGLVQFSDTAGAGGPGRFYRFRPQ